MIESNEGLASELARVLPLTNPWDPNPVEVPYTENDDEEVKVKTIRKSPRNTFWGRSASFLKHPILNTHVSSDTQTSLMKFLIQRKCE
jgi:hypothetical protein